MSSYPTKLTAESIKETRNLISFLPHLAESLSNRESYILKLKERKQKIKDEIADIEKDTIKYNKGRELYSLVIEYIKENDPIKPIEAIINDVLTTMFGEKNSTFVIESVEKRNQLETYFYMMHEFKDRMIKQDPLFSKGGGVLDVIFSILRIIIAVNHPTKPARIIFADEPAKNLSLKYRNFYIKLIKKICEDFDMRWYMTTHEEEYISESDQIFKTTISNGVTDVECIIE